MHARKSAENHKDNAEKLAKVKRMHERRILEKWTKALAYIGIDGKGTYSSVLEKAKHAYPFNECSVARVTRGEFQQKKLDRILLEIIQFEVMNQCFYARFKVATLHSNA